MTEATKKASRARSSRKSNTGADNSKVEITLADIVQATLDESKPEEQRFVYTNLAQHGQLESLGLVEVNESLMDANGDIATRATQKGIEEYQKSLATHDENSVESVSTVKQDSEAEQPKQTEQPKETKKMAFTIDTDVALPKIVRGRAAEAKYPFDEMEVGHSFFVGATEDRQEPWKSLASVVSSANKRYEQEIPGETRVNKKGNTVAATVETRKYVIRKVEGGARIFRTK